MITDARRRWGALAVLMLPVLIVSISNTAVVFAVPGIARHLRPSGEELLWLVDIYALILAGLLIPMGGIGDRIGRRRILLIGCTGYGLVSALGAASPNIELLISSRAGIGIFGAMIMPATLSLIRNIFVESKERRLAIAIWAAGFSGGAAVGPVVGGFLVAHFYWGSVFLLAIPLLVPLIIGAPILVPESRNPHPGPMDPLSIVLSFLSMGSIALAIKEVAVQGLTGPIVVCLVVGIASSYIFVRRQLAADNPMLDMNLFRNGRFSGSIASNLISIFGFVGFTYVVPQHFQQVRGYDPMTSGFFLTPGMIVTIVAGLLVVRAALRFDDHVLVTTGLLFDAVGYALVAVSVVMHSDIGIVLAFMVVGLGVGSAETISNDMIISVVPPEKAGAASAISETAYEVGAVLGIAVLGSLVNAVYRAKIVLPEGLSDAQASASRDTLGGALSVAENIGGAGAQLAEPARQAFDMGIVVTSGVAACALLAGAAMAWTTLRERR